MHIVKGINAISIILMFRVLAGCSKLEQNPGNAFHVIESLEDMRKLLDNEELLSQTHSLGIISADEWYCMDDFRDRMSAHERNAYTWNKTFYEGDEPVMDWDLPYKQIFYANQVLEGLQKIVKNPGNQIRYETLEGTACFIRANAIYNLSQIFAEPYDSLIAETAPGIPLRLSTDVTQASKRASLQDTYERIIKDLARAAQLLPPVPETNYRNRPSKASVHALLGRVFLSMRNYSKAALHADSCLKLYDILMDYNDIDTVSDNPFVATNPEVLYQSRVFTKSSLIIGFLVMQCGIDSNIYRSYVTDDIRKKLFFKKTPGGMAVLKGSYYGTSMPFTGLATDEVYLIRAECNARASKPDAALHDLNTLMQRRWRHGRFKPYEGDTVEEVLELILAERLKELIFRGVRWSDLRRFNKEGIGKTLQRYVGNEVFQLKANDARYVLPIPDYVIRITGMTQNPR